MTNTRKTRGLPPLTPEERDRITRLFGTAIAGLANDPPVVCRTLDEITAAGARDALNDPPLTQAQADRVAAILAPYRRQLAAREAFE
jgi:hypothetical protein